MKIELYSDGKAEIAKLTFTSNLSEKVICRRFGISVGQLRASSKQLNTKNITLQDLILGALYSQPKSSVSEIVEYVDFKDHFTPSPQSVLGELKTLVTLGRVYQHDDLWNISERSIECFSNTTEFLTDKCAIAGFDLDSVKSYFNPPKDDPLMYNIYDLTADNYHLLDGCANYVFDFQKNSYYLACRQVENEN